jgi:phage shock protein A
MTEKLADAKARQKTILLRQSTATSRLDVKKTLDSSKVEDAMGRFEQYERKINDIEAQVDAYDLGNKSLNDEFAELQADDKVEDELTALKAQLAKKAKLEN